jgi:hypothetical protein
MDVEEIMKNSLEIFDDPMEWRELLDRHRQLPLWVRFLSKLRYILGI